MNVQFQPDFRTAERRLPFECVALVLQGGGALGAYQAGVYEALVEAKINPDWVAGVSIGAINAAIIAGNEPAARVAKLRAFWEEITANPLLDSFAALDALTPKGHLPRALFNQLSAASALVAGAAGFFSLRQPPPWLHPDGALEATSFYETSLLKSTLERLVDFDRINAREMRFSAGAVNVRTGNFVYFDNETHTIRAEHVMASGSLPPSFPAVEIEGEFYWDGGLVSNTPLQWVVENGPRQDTLAFQVDLWSARGELSGNLAEVAMRQKEIQFSSRTRANTDQFKQQQRALITYRTDPQKLRELVPEPLQVREPLVKFEFIRMPDSTGFGDYTESGQVIPVTFRGRKGSYTHCMFLNDHPPIAGGRELWGPG